MLSHSVKGTKIIERTVPEVFKCNKSVGRLDIINLCWSLCEAGADLLEIDAGVLKKIGRLPQGVDFICRVESEDEIRACMDKGIRNLVMSADLHSKTSRHEYFATAGINTTVEYEIPGKTALDCTQQLLRLKEYGPLNNIRLTGLWDIIDGSWIDVVKGMEKDLNVSIDLCPVNRTGIATAVAVEGYEAGIGYITAAFAGFGHGISFAPLEEVLAAIKFILNTRHKMNLAILPAICRCFVEMTGVAIPETKPVIGADIFKYESGIHADGINKNPFTYEPFDPFAVGLQRKICIGKHSGTGSVMAKASELGLECSIEQAVRMLDIIRAKSIELKRELNDDEFKCIYKQTGGYE